jgi:sigma-B regulation protein RsbU (phosphoserine phosphatase)
VRTLSTGETLLSPGEPSHHLYLLLEGRLSVHLDAAGSAASFQVSPGQCVGEMSLVDGRPASAFVVASGPCRVVAVPEAVFWSGLMTVEGLGRNLLRVIAGRIRERTEITVRVLRQQLHYEALQRELDVAREIQTSMLPAAGRFCDQHPNVDVHALMYPARDVGGDFFDVFPLDAGRVLLAVGDVSGKGMPAALFMVRSLTVLRMEAVRAETSEGLLARVNRELCEGNPRGMFTTALAGVLDVGSGELRYFNGGHLAPLLSRDGGPFTPVPMPRGLVLGAVDGVPFEHRALQLQAGDRLVVYSDGVTEAEDAFGNFFGEERLREVLERCGRHDAEGLVTAVREAVEGFSKDVPQSDDVTVLALVYRGPNPTGSSGAGH